MPLSPGVFFLRVPIEKARSTRSNGAVRGSEGSNRLRSMVGWGSIKALLILCQLLIKIVFSTASGKGGLGWYIFSQVVRYIRRISSGSLYNLPSCFMTEVGGVLLPLLLLINLKKSAGSVL